MRRKMRAKDEAVVQRKLAGWWCENQLDLNGQDGTQPHDSTPPKPVEMPRTDVLTSEAETAVQEGLWEDPSFLRL